MESSVVGAPLTHYSTEPLTTGPDYDPLLLLCLALDGDVHPNPGPSRYPCLVYFKNVTSQGTCYLCTRCSHWVHSRCSGLRNAANYRKANGWICTACMTPPRPRAPESKLTANSRSPNIQNYTLVRHDRRQGPGGGLLFFFHNSSQLHSQVTCQKRRRMAPT